MFRFFYSILVLSCSITTSALGSPSLLSQCSIITISLHITIILTMALMSFCLSTYMSIYISTSLHLCLSTSISTYIYLHLYIYSSTIQYYQLPRGCCPGNAWSSPSTWLIRETRCNNSRTQNPICIRLDFICFSGGCARGYACSG